MPSHPTPTARAPHTPACTRHILYIFSGPERPDDGLEALARMRGWRVTAVDVLTGGDADDVARRSVQRRLLRALERREFDVFRALLEKGEHPAAKFW